MWGHRNIVLVYRPVLASIDAYFEGRLKGTVCQAIQMLIILPIKYVLDVINCCILLYHTTKWQQTSLLS